MTSAFLSVAMLGGFALIWGAWLLWQREGLGQKVWLMIAAALVLFANVAIWTVPDEAGQTLVNSKNG
jgi:drug/metabolite transporter superfamily protein YnfA